MKKLLPVMFVAVTLSPAFAGVIKESQAKREVEDAIQALNVMDSRQDLATFLPQKEAYLARTYHNKARNFLSDGEYDKASFYAVLSANNSKISIAKALLAKAEHDKLAALAEGRALEMVAPLLKSAGLKQKGSSGVFSGTYDLKALYDLKRTPKVDEVPGLTEDAKKNIADISSVLVSQKDVKVSIVAKGKTEDHAAKYADSVKFGMVEKGVQAERINVTTKKGKDGVEVTLEGVKTR
jgi:hypothetical protein